MPTEARTHLAIDRRWSGELIALEEGCARVRLETRSEMAVDDRGLLHVTPSHVLAGPEGDPEAA